MWNIVKAGYGALVVILLLMPLLAILPLAFTSSILLAYPIPEFSLRWFDTLFQSDDWRRSIFNSLIVGMSTAVLATVLGTLAALGLSVRFRFFRTLRTIFILPLVVPSVVLGLGMQLLFVRLGLANSYIGLIIAHIVVSVPFVVITVTASLQGIDHRLADAALSLGATPVKAFFHVTLPLARPGILSGAAFALATSFDEVILTLFVAGPNQRTLARRMFSLLRDTVSPEIAAATFLLMVATILVGIVSILSQRRR